MNITKMMFGFSIGFKENIFILEDIISICLKIHNKKVIELRWYRRNFFILDFFQLKIEVKS